MEVHWFRLGDAFNDEFSDAVFRTARDAMVSLGLYLYRVGVVQDRTGFENRMEGSLYGFSKIRKERGMATVRASDWLEPVSFITYWPSTIASAIEYVHEQQVKAHNEEAVKTMEPLPFEPKPYRRKLRF